MRAPGPRGGADGSAPATGPLAGAGPRLERGEPPLHAAQAPRELRQVALEDEDALGLDQRARRRAEHLLARRDVAGEAGLRGDDGAVTDREMVGDAHLSGEHDTPADPARPGDPYLGDDDRVLADLDVVTDLHEVVDLGPPADDRLPQGGTVDGRVGADLDVVLDQHGADLRDLPVRLAVESVAEAVGADHRARGDHDALAEPPPGADGQACGHD